MKGALRLARFGLAKLGLAVAVLMVATPAVRAEFALTDNDRVILFGDSALSDTYSFDWLEQFTRTKYPDFKGEIIRFGQARSSAADGNRRFATEVAPLKPTKVVLCFGLDDGQRKALDPARVKTFTAEMSKMIDTVRASGAEVCLMTPPPPDVSRNRTLGATKYGKVIDAYAKAVRKLAEEKNAPLLDWHDATKTYIDKREKNEKIRWTKDGIVPAPISVAVACDLLLQHWKAEPLNYRVTATWGSDEGATATIGSAKVLNQNATTMTLELKGVPVSPDNRARGTLSDARWPLAKWCVYRLHIANMPKGGVIISEKGKAAKPFLSQQLTAQAGADLSVVGPLVDNEHAKMLHNATRTKIKQYSHFRGFAHKKAPEPELTEGYNLWLKAYQSLAEGTHKIMCRTPSRFDAVLTLKLARKSAQATAGH